MKLSQLNQLPAELQAMISFVDLAVGQTLVAQHEPAEAIFILASGSIQLLNYTEDGQQINHYSVRVGESFAEVALFYEQYVCTAIAIAPSRVLVLPKQPFLTALKASTALAVIFMEQLAQRLHESKILLELRSIRSAQKRVLHYLQLNVQSDGITVNFDRSLKAIADDLGLTPEALSRSLKQLHRDEKINRRKRKVTLRKEFSELDSNHGGSNAIPVDS
ncbi:Crp/Fnr family transcriptional regulator [Stenomitos frigidus]|uniref:Crp/Fnr family transcriptional regulator n=1 Tax=Stenomitos frigidus ULC18 TaxID=2107698 RepID=A0A2T1DV09_9CYAN|nr:Crp/Fnr family transcriptional regulator [Stenomitos frigidus]PSB24319.1 Crp/Fnr family transcriptional regulator [Stenomitos frigidus ULC18]